MIKHVAWALAVALGFLIGANAGSSVGAEAAASKIANDCRQAGRFAVKRTGFECRRLARD